MTLCTTRLTRGARPALTDFQKASHRTRTGERAHSTRGLSAVQYHSTGGTRGMTPWSLAESKGRVVGLATRAMLQLLIEPKFDHHPLSFACRHTFKIDEKRPPSPGNQSRTVGDGQIFSRFDSPVVIFSLTFSVSDMHCIRPW